MASVTKIERAAKVIEVTLGATKARFEADVIENLWGVYMDAGVSGDTVRFCVAGKFKGCSKLDGTGLTWAVGQRLYWNDGTEQEFQTNATDGSDVQQNIVAQAAALATATTGDVEVGFGD